MNEQLNETVVALVERAVGAIDAGADFLAGEIPLYVQELLVWEAFSNGFLALFFLALCALSVHAVRRGFFHARECVKHNEGVGVSYGRGYRNQDGGYVLMIVGVCSGILWMGLCASAVHQMMYVVVAPRVYLVEYVAKLTGGQ